MAKWIAASLWATASCVELIPSLEWQIVGENDTIPPGAHVKMDLTEGGTWVKILEDEDEPRDSPAALTVQPENASRSERDLGDVDTMHRALSRIPEEELARMGGLPRPGSAGFEARTRELWRRRQEELAEIQKEIADPPSLLSRGIESIRSHLEQGGEVEETLKELEYLLSDIDNARDFHTLGGWPLLASLLLSEDTSVRALAAWAMGTAVKNTMEFRPWTTQLLPDGSTPLALLLGAFPARLPLAKKLVYALGAFLRGNSAAREEFFAREGETKLMEAMEEDGVAVRVLTLVADLAAEEESFGEEGWCRRARGLLPKGKDMEKLLLAIRALGCPGAELLQELGDGVDEESLLRLVDEVLESREEL